MFFKNISIIYRHSEILFQKRLSGMQLNNTEQSILLYLKHNDGVNQHAIARFFSLIKPLWRKLCQPWRIWGLLSVKPTVRASVKSVFI